LLYNQAINQNAKNTVLYKKRTWEGKMKGKMRLLKLPLLVLCLLLAVATQANALSLSPEDAVLSANIFPPSEPNILNYISLAGFDLGELLYKSNVGGAEEGPLANSYDTSYFDTPSDPSGAEIRYISGDFVGAPAYLYVKDGNANPSFYLFELIGWDGMETLYLSGFWPGPGAISHLSLYGTAVSVAEPATLLLLGFGLIGLAGLGKRFRKA
jgi:hypothetical protein